MFGKKFFAVFGASLALVVIAMLLAMSNNQYDHSWSLSDGFQGFASLFGGATSVWSIALVIVLLGFVYWAIHFAIRRATDKNPDTGPRVGAALALVAVIIAAFVSEKWVRTPSGSAIAILVVLLALVLFTLLVLSIADGRIGRRFSQWNANRINTKAALRVAGLSMVQPQRADPQNPAPQQPTP